MQKSQHRQKRLPEESQQTIKQHHLNGFYFAIFDLVANILNMLKCTQFRICFWGTQNSNENEKWWHFMYFGKETPMFYVFLRHSFLYAFTILSNHPSFVSLSLSLHLILVCRWCLNNLFFSVLLFEGKYSERVHLWSLIRNSRRFFNDHNLHLLPPGKTRESNAKPPERKICNESFYANWQFSSENFFRLLPKFFSLLCCNFSAFFLN